MADFLILKANLPNYTKKDIDLGNILQDLYSLCSIIRECFCLSYSIRKDTRLYLHFIDSKLTIKLEGKKLKYLGSDERSQALLLYKAISKKIESFSPKWEQSTPGIYIMVHTRDLNVFDLILKETNEEVIFVLDEKCTEKSKNIEEINTPNQKLYILPSNAIDIEIHEIENIFKKLNKQLIFVSLPKIKSIENKVLYINFKIDQKENL
ncbi:MAG: hypothetical protein ACFFKA_21870 [Candidatus Thorarchaeota archaeon]